MLAQSTLNMERLAMKSLKSLAIVFCLPILSTRPCEPRAQAPDLTVILADRLIDGTGHSSIVDGPMLIRGNRIEHVGKAGSSPITRGARTIEARGKTLRPG